MGDNFYFQGYDLSGDINSLGKVGGGPALLEVPGIDRSAMERLTALFSGEISLVAYFNNAAAQEHAAFSQLLTTDIVGSYFRGTTLGNPAFGLYGRQINYDPNRAAGGALTEAVQLLSDAHAGMWGRMLTAGKDTDSASTNGTGVDHGAAQVPVVNISSVTVANPGQINTSTAHGLQTGDSVTIAGTTTTPNINSDYPVTVVNATRFTIPVNVTSGQAGAAGTVQQTSTDFGLSLFYHLFALTGTSIALKVQHSADNGVADAYADITGATTGALSSAPAAGIIETATGVIVKRWTRRVSTGVALTSATFALHATRHHLSTI